MWGAAYTGFVLLNEHLGNQAAPPRTPQVQGAATRRRILEAARDLFRNNGYQGSSVADIARRVGITPAALYWHFDSKAAILAELLEDALGRFFTRMDEAAVGTTPSERLYSLVREHVRYQLTDSDPEGIEATVFAWSQLLRWLPADRRADLVVLERAYFRRIEALLEEGRSLEEFVVEHVSAAAFAIINLAEYVVTWYQPEGDLSVDDVAHLHALMALRMVGGRVPGVPTHRGRGRTSGSDVEQPQQPMRSRLRAARRGGGS